MGIPYFVASLLRTGHAKLLKNVRSLRVSVLGIDGNCLIHRYLDPTNPIQSVLHALNHITNDICQAERIVLALDGLVPYAKMVQQRYRRMRPAEDSVFDRNQISPGTPYMKELEAGIRSRFPHIELSATNEPGEGEHKLFQRIGNTKSIAIYGLDADLVLLCLARASLSTNFVLLRESADMDTRSVSETEFSTMNIQGLKTLIERHMKLSDFIAMSILCFGNDFMPKLGMFSLRANGFQTAMRLSETLRETRSDLTTFEGRDLFLATAGELEHSTLLCEITKRNIPFELGIVDADFGRMRRQYRLHVLDGVEDIRPVVDAYWKTFHWTWLYFTTNQVPDWNWYYPYPDAPFVADILDYDEPIFTFPFDTPTFEIADQLSFILPAHSLRIAKKRVVYPAESYTKTREGWLTRYEWEQEPRISLPWIPIDCRLTSIDRRTDAETAGFPELPQAETY